MRESYGKTEIIHGITCDLEDGEFMVIVDPSGRGNSTLLRMIVWLEAVSAEEIALVARWCTLPGAVHEGRATAKIWLDASASALSRMPQSGVKCKSGVHENPSDLTSTLPKGLWMERRCCVK